MSKQKGLSCGSGAFLLASSNMHCVIGSGPAGVACAKALLARGASVLMLDAGLDLEPGHARSRSPISLPCNPPTGPPTTDAELKGKMTAECPGHPAQAGVWLRLPLPRDGRKNSVAGTRHRRAPVAGARRFEQCLGCGHAALSVTTILPAGRSKTRAGTALPRRDSDSPAWPRSATT